MADITHSDLVAKAEAWLRRNGWKVVLTELRTSSPEEPDAIGFCTGASHLIECKASRADFLADRKKFFRRNPKHGMGTMRSFLTPAGLVAPHELPENWGLLEVRGRRVWRVVDAVPFDDVDAIKAEREFIYSVLRRMDMAGLLNQTIKEQSALLTLAAKKQRLECEVCSLEKQLKRERYNLRRAQEQRQKVGQETSTWPH
jgi:hypothetical protein